MKTIQKLRLAERQLNHDNIVNECQALGLTVQQTPDTGRRSYSATSQNIRVYWSISYEGSLLGLPRVARNGSDTHARSIREIRYLVCL